MKVRVALFALGALVLPVEAATIGGGQFISDPLQQTGSFTFIGPNFVVNGVAIGGVFGGGCDCPPGTEVGISASTSGSDILFSSGVVDGVPYHLVNFGDAQPSQSIFQFGAPNIVLTAPGSFRVPFTFSGQLAAFTDDLPGLPCVTCEADGVTPTPISGAGVATVRVVSVNGLLGSQDVTYTFIPEPGTLWLALLSLVALVGAKRGQHVGCQR